MSLPFKLTLDHLKQSCREAYAAKTLLAQMEYPDRYAYEVGSYHCAVGCALPREALDAIEAAGGQGKTINNANVIRVVRTDPDEHDQIYLVQYTHDRWLDAKRQGIQASWREQKFLNLIKE